MPSSLTGVLTTQSVPWFSLSRIQQLPFLVWRMFRDTLSDRLQVSRNTGLTIILFPSHFIFKSTARLLRFEWIRGTIILFVCLECHRGRLTLALLGVQWGYRWAQVSVTVGCRSAHRCERRGSVSAYCKIPKSLFKSIVNTLYPFNLFLCI